MQSPFFFGSAEKHRKKNNLLRDIYNLRYQVYVNEWDFEAADDHPGGMEKDKYDEHSVHYFACDITDCKVIATARMILNSNLGFPIEKIFRIDQGIYDLNKCRIGEISRLAVSKEYRQRAIDKAIFGTGSYDPKHIPRYVDEGRDLRRHCEHELVRGLYLCIYRDSKKRGLEFWYAIMSKGLHVILRRWGIPFVQVGAEINYHGIRAPYFARIKDVELSLERVNPELLREAKRNFLH